MLTKAALAAMATFWSPAGAAELQSYAITVLEQIRTTSPSRRTTSLRREPLLYWKRAELRDLVIRLGNLRRQLYWRVRVNPTALQ